MTAHIIIGSHLAGKHQSLVQLVVGLGEVGDGCRVQAVIGLAHVGHGDEVHTLIAGHTEAVKLLLSENVSHHVLPGRLQLVDPGLDVPELPAVAGVLVELLSKDVQLVFNTAEVLTEPCLE